MKRNTQTQNLKATFFRGLPALFLMCALSANGQIANKGNLYIADNANMYIGSSTYYFESGGSSATSRTASVHGALSFSSAASFNGASDSHFLNGYAKAIGSAAVTFPIGQTAVYAPAKVAPSATATTNAAYFRSAPTTVGASIDDGLSAISAVEYWDIVSSSNAVISLTWRSSSDLALLSGNTLSKLTIAGWNGSAWVEIPSTVDATSILGVTSTLSEGSITSDAVVLSGVYTAFTLGIKGDCASLVTSSGITKTWNGSWSPSAPTITDPVVISTAYSAGSFSCNSLTLNADVTLANGQFVEVVNGVSGTGKVFMANEASFVQRNPASLAPTIELTKVTRPMRRYDYIYLSSPINNATDFYNLLLNKNNTAVNAEYGTYPLSAFNSVRERNTAGTGFQNITTPTIGKGVVARVRNQAPYNTSAVLGSWDNELMPIHMKIPGTANNGPVNALLTSPEDTSAIIGNPYPCAIDGEKLLAAGGVNIRQTIYYWTFNTPTSHTNTYNTVGDYASWTLAGGVAATNSPIVPNGSIASMQSVLIVSATNTPASLNITNCMKKTGNNDVFFRTTTPGSKDRFWLNLTGSGTTQSQILLAYISDATYGDDLRYDAKRLSGTGYTYMSSLIDNNNYVIQAKPSFEDTDVVPLGIYKAGNETFTISLGNKEGVFNEGQQIYLHDKALGIYHNLANGPYAFTQPTTGTDNARFEIVYQDASLGMGHLDNTHVLANINNQVFTATAASAMESVQVFDITGRKIQEFSADGQTSITAPFHHAQAIYIAKIKLATGAYATVKLINQ